MDLGDATAIHLWRACDASSWPGGQELALVDGLAPGETRLPLPSLADIQHRDARQNAREPRRGSSVCFDSVLASTCMHVAE